MLGTATSHCAQGIKSNHQLELFAIRCGELAARALSGQIAFTDAVDILYDAAVWSDLVAGVGDDVVQAIMASAFADARAVLP